MAARRALLYCTVNGVCNNTNGLGRQTKTLLSTFDLRADELVRQAGPLDLHLACPQPGPATWGYDQADLAYAERVAAAWGGAVHPLPYDLAGEFWSVPTWTTLCAGAAEVAARLAHDYDDLVMVGVDTPFSGLGSAIAAIGPSAACRIQTVLSFYSTAVIVERPTPNPARVAWERAGVASASRLSDVWIGDVGRYLTTHLGDDYGLDPTRLVPFTSSLNLASPDLQPMPRVDAERVATTWGLPLDRPIVLTIGRTDPTKGIDLLLDAVAPLRDDVHVVVIAVPLPGRESLLDDYRHQIAAHRLRATLVGRYTRDLPRALCSLPITKIVACPSRGETLANVPFEVALWARDGGPIVLAPRRDGFIEQIDHGVTGLFYDDTEPKALSGTTRRALDLDPTTRAAMLVGAYRHVCAQRDSASNWAATLQFLAEA